MWEGKYEGERSRYSGEAVDWTQTAQDRVQWWAFVNMVLRLWVP
jgi:hypothetical protein